MLAKNSESVYTSPCFFDDEFPVEEQLPRVFSIEFKELENQQVPTTQMSMGGTQMGDYLTDNSYTDDGYRYHDAFHYALVAVLGWSPCARNIFRCKRKSHPIVDRVEDGARAMILEESISAILFERARENEFFENCDEVDAELLTLVKSLTKGREVYVRSLKEWENAVLQGFYVWRKLVENSGGILEVDSYARRIDYKCFGESS